MFIRLCFAAILFVSSTLNVIAAECNCETEINNASAKTSDACGKIWKDNHCTLKESTVSNSNASSWGPALERVDFQIPITIEPKPVLDLLGQPESFRGVINVLILNLLSDVAPPEFTSAVLETLNSGEGKNQMLALSQGNESEGFTELGDVPLAISQWCIYGGRPDLNFYLNLRPDSGFCPVADLVGTLR